MPLPRSLLQIPSNEQHVSFALGPAPLFPGHAEKLPTATGNGSVLTSGVSPVEGSLSRGPPPAPHHPRSCSRKALLSESVTPGTAL